MGVKYGFLGVISAHPDVNGQCCIRGYEVRMGGEDGGRGGGG